MERKLATIRKISKVEKHPNADSLDICTVDGWKVVTRLNEFKEGDFAVYFEVDSFLPIRPEFEFLRKSSYKKLSDGREGFRLKTVRLRGELSQGLLLPLTILSGNKEIYNSDIKNISDTEIIYPILEFVSEPDGYCPTLFWKDEENNFPWKDEGTKFIELRENTNITELLEITKYDPPIGAILSRDAKGLFPSFLRKTDEERIQNIPWILEQYKNEKVYVTEKLDGTSATYYLKDGVFGVCSRNIELKEDERSLYWRMAKEYDLENKLKDMGNYAIQGEIIGPGIQGNKYKLKTPQLRVFNIFNIDTQSFLEVKEFSSIVRSYLLLDVPSLEFGIKLSELGITVSDLLKYAEDMSLLEPIQREGIVIRGVDEFNNIRGTSCGRLSFKVISNKYLLKEK